MDSLGSILSKDFVGYLMDTCLIGETTLWTVYVPDHCAVQWNWWLCAMSEVG